MASCGHYDQCETRIRPDHICSIRLLHPIRFQYAKLAQIQSGWPGQVLVKCIWSGNKPVCKNHQALFWQNATNPLLVSHFQTPLCSLGLSVEECNRVWKWETGSRPIAFCHNGAWWCLHTGLFPTGLFDQNLTRIILHKTSLGTIWF